MTHQEVRFLLPTSLMQRLQIVDCYRSRQGPNKKKNKTKVIIVSAIFHEDDQSSRNQR